MAARFHRMRKAFYWSAGALLLWNCAPHAIPGIIRKGYEMPGIQVPEDLSKHVHSIARAMRLPNADRIEVFITYGCSSVSGGSALMPGGRAVVGLPRTFLFRDSADVMRSGLSVNGEDVDWESEDGRKMAQLLLHSPQEMNFTIAHELSHVLNSDPLYITPLAPIALILSYHAGIAIPKFAFPRHTSAAFTIILCAGLVLCAQLSSAIRRWFEYRADRRAALCSKSYANGGVEFMRRKIQLESMFRPPSLTSFASSFNYHPSPQDRLERLEKLIALTNWP